MNDGKSQGLIYIAFLTLLLFIPSLGPLRGQLASAARPRIFHGISPALRLLPHERWCAKHGPFPWTSSLGWLGPLMVGSCWFRNGERKKCIPHRPGLLSQERGEVLSVLLEVHQILSIAFSSFSPVLSSLIGSPWVSKASPIGLTQDRWTWQPCKRPVLTSKVLPLVPFAIESSPVLLRRPPVYKTIKVFFTGRPLLKTGRVSRKVELVHWQVMLVDVPVFWDLQSRWLPNVWRFCFSVSLLFPTCWWCSACHMMGQWLQKALEQEEGRKHTDLGREDNMKSWFPSTVKKKKW